MKKLKMKKLMAFILAVVMITLQSGPVFATEGTVSEEALPVFSEETTVSEEEATAP
ncbi:MAG: hypothetical protein IK139_04375 [Lachnospiraceae bacterium]|nr:hypothetical protein [Lachnospiraceae bacterium]